MLKINLVVIKTKHPDKLKKQYEALGLTFKYHKHGKGPYHYSTDVDGLVFEIYPLSNLQTIADCSLRLGFRLPVSEFLLKDLEQHNWKIHSDFKIYDWGKTALIEDLDGRKIELTTYES